MNHELDERDRTILERRQALLDARPQGSIVQGDFLHMPDGSYRRIAHNWGDGAQPTFGKNSPCAGDESFYLSEGSVSFSGSLDSIIPMKLITPTDETREGVVWFFHHDYVTAGGGVRATARFRVFEVRCFSESDLAYLEYNYPNRTALVAAARQQDAMGFLLGARHFTQDTDMRISNLCDRINRLVPQSSEGVQA